MSESTFDRVFDIVYVCVLVAIFFGLALARRLTVRQAWLLSAIFLALLIYWLFLNSVQMAVSSSHLVVDSIDVGASVASIRGDLERALHVVRPDVQD